MKSNLTALLPQLHRSVFPALPDEQRPGLARHLAYANWLHALLLAPVIAVMNLAFGLLPELRYYRTGYWPLDRPHVALSALHVFMAMASLAAFALLIRWRPLEPRAAAAWHHRLALGYVAAMIASTTAFSIVEQQLTGSISAYLLGVAAFATLFYTTPRFSLIVCAASFAGLVTGSWWAYGDTATMWHQVFVALYASVTFWVGSRIVYSLKAANYLQLVTIEAQSRQLAASNAELAHASEFKTDLLARAAHDLRDPLNTISLSAQMLGEELPAGSPLLPIVGGIDDSARHLAESVKNLLTDVATDRHEIHLERKPTDLPRFVAEIVNQFRPLADAKSIALHFASAPTPEAVPAMVDHAHFRPVVENLITNAIKFSPPRKNVWIEVGHPQGGGHRISVRDEGPGLTADDQVRLFRKYQRLSARPTRGENSTGLGLFIVKQLVTLHGGRISAESAGPGAGTRFIVALPHSS